MSTLSSEEITRFSRNIALPEIGLTGQQRLQEGRVLVVGAGGLGCPTLTYLASAGVGTLGIVDGDRVESSNLQRQSLYGEADVGFPKVAKAKEKLIDLRSSIVIESYDQNIELQLGHKLIPDYDIVIDATDNFATRYLLNDLCGIYGKPLISASLHRFQGQLSVFHGRTSSGDVGPTLRCIYPEPPQDIPNCSEAGVLGALPGMIGSMQALEAMKLLAGFGEPLIGKLLILDGLDYSCRVVNVPRVVTEDPQPYTTWDEYQSFCGGRCSMSEIEEITPIKLKKMLDAKEDFTLVDVREAHELEICNLGGLHIPLKQIPERAAAEIPKDKPVVVYCRSGGRSFDACNYLAEDFEHPNVINLKGGVLLWSDQVDPSMPKY